MFNHPSIAKKDKDIEFNGIKKKQNKKFGKVDYQPAVDSHPTPKLYVDNALDENTLVRSNQDNGFNNQNPTTRNSIILNTPAVNDNQVVT